MIEKLKAKSIVLQQKYLWLDKQELKEERVILLDDAIEIMKELYTKEEVEELLKKQKVLCAERLTGLAITHRWLSLDLVIDAPQPELKK